MRTKFILSTLCVLLCYGGSAKATEFDFTISNTYDPNLLTLNNQSLLVEGGGVNLVWAYGNSYIEIRNTTPYEWHMGGLGTADLFNNSSINFFDGDTGGIVATDNSSVNIYGGKVRGLIITDNSSATLYGGNITGIRNSQFVPVDTEIDLEVVCKSWVWNESTNHITGMWGDDSPFDIGLLDTYWDNSEVYRMIDHISFTVIPEPITIIVLGLGGIFGVVKRKR